MSARGQQPKPADSSAQAIPLDRWISGDPARRPARWARWQLWPTDPDRPSYPRHVGRYVGRANCVAGGFYAELADTASGGTLAFVYPFPMKASWMTVSNFDEYDWADGERDKEAAILTAIAAAASLTALSEAPQPFRDVLDVNVPEPPSRREALARAEAARRRAKAGA